MPLPCCGARDEKARGRRSTSEGHASWRTDSAKRVTRLRVLPDGALTDREIYGPPSLGSGLIDGIAFDAVGNLWATMIFADRANAILRVDNGFALMSAVLLTLFGRNAPYGRGKRLV
jgi:hypothetical protein